MSRLFFVGVFALFLLAQPVFAGTVFLVRHAEKAKTPKDDPTLSWEGERRAKTLAAMLKSVSIDALFSSDYTRTKSTLKPLAKATGLDVTIYDAGDSQALARLVLEKHFEDTVVIAGHSNTVPELVKAFGGEAEPLEETEYDNLFVVTLHPNGLVSTLRLHFGVQDKQ